uniref:Uncharacterized protein n=1 Tax=Aegilops tauschii subsp. strangulata TaxID=200361 RepID=A0A453D357_AEGTS
MHHKHTSREGNSSMIWDTNLAGDAEKTQVNTQLLCIHSSKISLLPHDISGRGRGERRRACGPPRKKERHESNDPRRNRSQIAMASTWPLPLSLTRTKVNQIRARAWR